MLQASVSSSVQRGTFLSLAYLEGECTHDSLCHSMWPGKHPSIPSVGNCFLNLPRLLTRESCTVVREVVGRPWGHSTGAGAGQEVFTDRKEPGPRGGHTGRGLQGREQEELRAEKGPSVRLPGAVVAREKSQAVLTEMAAQDLGPGMGRSIFRPKA